MTTFGERFRALMAERRVSQRRLADLVPCNDGYLSRVARGERVPSGRIAERLDELLDAGGQLAALRDPSPWRTLNGAVSLDDRERLALAAKRPARLDTATLDTLSAVLAGQRRLEDTIGPAALLSPVTGQLDVLTSMLRDAPAPMRDRFGRLVAEWSVFAGWLNAALRRDAQAVALFDRGAELADEFEDGTIAALAVSFAGYVARQQGRPRAVVRASAAALATPGAHPAQRVFDRLQSARAHAALGYTDQARRILHDAADHADDVTDPPPPIYWYSPPFFRLVIGITLSSLGDHEDAAALVAEGKAGLPVEQQSAEWVAEFDEILERDRAD
ncbi:helix-turn-helix transcriptional regulator [Actinomadura sp. WMMA1423]|uniref:helix-turn-helix domain-containing protein n=1 Tax=Actinomadura sp. WMMA1423 TaxID=2591108 RepID=UPI0011473095|nr:helix-turn-helix transcriptional regulator [Actinomadura sp. WMMA1423]